MTPADRASANIRSAIEDWPQRPTNYPVGKTHGATVKPTTVREYWTVTWVPTSQLMFSAPSQWECMDFIRKYQAKDQPKMRILSSKRS